MTTETSEKEEYKLNCLVALEKQIYQAQENLKTCIGLLKSNAADNEDYIFNSTDDALLTFINCINKDSASAARWLGMVVGLKMAWYILHTQELEDEKSKLLVEKNRIEQKIWEIAKTTGKYGNEDLKQRLDEICKRLLEIEVKEARIRNGG